MPGCVLKLRRPVQRFQRSFRIALNLLTPNCPRSFLALEPGASRAASTAARSASHIRQLTPVPLARLSQLAKPTQPRIASLMDCKEHIKSLSVSQTELYAVGLYDALHRRSQFLMMVWCFRNRPEARRSALFRRNQNAWKRSGPRRESVSQHPHFVAIFLVA
jgi:hypothetical protein